MFGVGDPRSTGLGTNLARPDGSTTGLSQLSPKLSAKRLALLKEVVPEAAAHALAVQLQLRPPMLVSSNM